MKKLVLLIAISICGLMSQTSQAQISIRANINLQPLWGPVGYDYVDYYFLPECDAYYYVPTHMFFYLDNGRWINRPYLPARYRNFDLYNCRKIVINEPRPYLRNQYYRERYANPRGYTRAMAIRDSRDSRYFVISNHPMHGQYNNGRGHMKEERVIEGRNYQNRGQYMRQMREENRNQNSKGNDNRNREHGPDRDRR